MVFDIIEHLQIRPELKESILEFRKQYPVEPQFQSRIPVPSNIYYGTDIWEKAVTALLCGKNILLVGHKATGKNIFAENLAAAFARPRWDVSFHVNMDAASLIGMDTFKKQEVTFRPGPICCAAQHGGFAVLDEINMAKSEALAVLHGTLDFRRSIDVPGYERIDLHPATRFIATMNYGYAGTKELNEALVSRFVVIRMPMISQEHLILLLQDHYPTLKTEGAKELAAVYLDLQKIRETIGTVTEEPGVFFRIPGGEYNNEVLRTIYACGSYPVAWSVDSMDWKEYEAGELVRQLLQSCTIRDGEILRFHGEGENTGEMVKLLHPRLKEEGYEAVTVSQMVYKDRYRMTTDGRQIPEKSK